MKVERSRGKVIRNYCVMFGIVVGGAVLMESCDSAKSKYLLRKDVPVVEEAYDLRK